MTETNTAVFTAVGVQAGAQFAAKCRCIAQDSVDQVLEVKLIDSSQSQPRVLYRAEIPLKLVLQDGFDMNDVRDNVRKVFAEWPISNAGL